MILFPNLNKNPHSETRLHAQKEVSNVDIWITQGYIYIVYILASGRAVC